MSKSIFDIFIDLYENNYIDGNYSIKSEYADLDIEYIKKTGNQTISSDTSWGNTTADLRNLFVCVDGDLTVNSGCTLTATTRKRGMFIWVRGNLTLNGTISMTARGASAAGQRLLLCNIGSDYEVPAVGGAGGAGAVITGEGGATGGTGTSGSATNSCGGGAGGGAAGYSGTHTGGNGAAGTSYSGGSAGGGCSTNDGNYTAGSGATNGGKGGDGNSGDGDHSYGTGGTGNPGGGSGGNSGTGGLLVIYVKKTITFGANGSLISNGTNGANYGNPGWQGAGGGGSGGGHIDCFYGKLVGTPILTVTGGTGGTGSAEYRNGYGGTGGDGSSRATQVDLTYYTIMASAGEGGSISPSGKSIVFANNYITYTITPNTYYQIDDVLVDSISVGAVSTYTFNSVSNNHTIQAVFSEKSTSAIVSIATPLSLKVTKEINGSWYANMTILPDDYIQTESYVDIEGEEYVVKKINKTLSGGKYLFDVLLYHNAIEELSNQTIDRFDKLDTVSNLLAMLLAGSGWTKGEVDIGETVFLKADKRVSILEALTDLAELTGGEIDYHSKDRIVDLKRKIGNETGLQLRCDKNLTEIQREEDSTGLITRIYPYDADNNTINTTVLDDCEDETLWTASSGGTISASNILKKYKSIGLKINSTTLNETFIHNLGGNTIDLSGHDLLKFWIYSDTDNSAGLTFGIGENAYNEITVNTGALSAKNWYDVSLDLSSVADSSKNAIKYLGFKNLSSSAIEVVFDYIRAFNGDTFIDSPNADYYRIKKEYVYQHSSRPEKTKYEKLIYPSDDTYVRQNQANTNFGNSGLMGTYYIDYADPHAILIKFNLSQIPEEAVIESASLNLEAAYVWSSNSSINVYKLNADWNENTVTWNNKPAVGASIGTLSMGSGTGLKTFDIKSTVEEWFSGAVSNYGLYLMMASSSSAWFYTKESLMGKPYIKVTYTITTDPEPVIKASALEKLQSSDEPQLKYNVKASDLSKVIVDTWEEETIELGDTCKIYDHTIRDSQGKPLNVSVRVKKITRDILNPSDIDIELVNKTYSFIDSQAKISRQLSYAMPFEDNPNVINANAVQYGYTGGSVDV